MRVYLNFERWLCDGDPRYIAMTRMMVPMLAVPLALVTVVATVAGIGAVIDQTALSGHQTTVEVAGRSMIPSHVPDGRNNNGVTGVVLPDTWLIDIKDTPGSPEAILEGKTFRMEVSRALYDKATPGKALEVEYEVGRIGRKVVIEGIGDVGPGSKMEKVPGIRAP
jgi:hypothetical protein